MNREIQELREVITKLVPLLTGKGLKVTQRGTQAYVSACPKTNKPQIVNIPSIPDNASPDFIAAVSGFVDHEVAHVLFTDWKYYGGDGVALDKFSPEGRALTINHNIIEDTMIERQIIKTFPGSEGNLDRLHRHFLEKITTPAVKMAKGNENEEFNYLIVPMMRALSGQELFQDYMDRNGYWDQPLIKNLHLAMSDEALDMIQKATTTQETLIVAQEIHDILFNNKQKEEPEQAPPPPSSGPSQDKPEKKAGQGDGDGERDHSESEEDGDESDQQSDGGSSKGKPQKPEKEESEDEAEGAGGDAGEKQKEEDDEDGDGSAGGNAEDDADEDGDEEDDGDAGGSGDESDDQEEQDASAGAGDDEDDEDAEDSSDDDGDGADGDDDDAEDEEDGVGSGDEEEDDEASSEGENELDEDEEDEGEEDYEDIAGSQTSGNEEENEAGEDNGAGGEAGKSMFDLDPADFKPVDLSSAIAEEIQQMAMKAVHDSDYSVFTKDEDEIKTFEIDEKDIDDAWVPQLEESVAGLVGPMQKGLERLMAAQSLAVRTPGHRSGRLHAPSLYRVMQGDPRVFQRKEEQRTVDTAVMLLVDNSGSMSGKRIVTAMQSSYALAQTLERVGVANEIMGFTTGNLSRAAYNQLSDEHRKGMSFHRTHTLIMPIFKHFNERVTPVVKRRIAGQMNLQIGMNTNTDGESLEYAALRLIPRREKRKVMLVMSDGQPVGPGSGFHLKKTVADLNRSGIETVGIGIQSSAVQSFYERSIVLNNVQDLPAAVMGELKRILIH